MPRSARDDSFQPPFAKRAVRMGFVVGLLIMVLVAGTFALNTRPSEPYGIRQRQWDFMREEQKAEVIAKANRDYLAGYLPFFLIYGVLPGLVSFFLIREFGTEKPSLQAVD